MCATRVNSVNGFCKCGDHPTNDRLLEALDKSVGLFSAFNHANEFLQRLLTGLIKLITRTGYINVDIKDFYRIIEFQGDALLGIGQAQQEHEYEQALAHALNNPLIANNNISGAQGIIIQINCKHEPALSTYDGILDSINSKLSYSTCLIIAGVMLDPELECELEILLIATGIDVESKPNQAISAKEQQYLYTNEISYLRDDVEQYTDIPSIVRKMTRAKVNNAN